MRPTPKQGFTVAVVILALLAATVLLFNSGCSTPLRTTYVATGTVATTVDITMQAWADYVVAGHATQEQDQKARELYTQYLRAMKVAREILSASIAYPNSVDDAKLKLLLQAVSDSSADLIAFVTPLMNKH